MSICARIVVAVPLQEIDCAPYRETRANGDNQRLQYLDCAVKKLHTVLPSYIKLFI